MVGCQNYGPLRVPSIIRPLIFRVPKKRTIILTTTHMFMELSLQRCCFRFKAFWLRTADVSVLGGLRFGLEAWCFRRSLGLGLGL